MNKETLSKIQQAIENATSALERLETALDQNDQRKAGAALYELKQALQEATREAHEANSR